MRWVTHLCIYCWAHICVWLYIYISSSTLIYTRQLISCINCTKVQWRRALVRVRLRRDTHNACICILALILLLRRDAPRKWDARSPMEKDAPTNPCATRIGDWGPVWEGSSRLRLQHCSATVAWSRRSHPNLAPWAPCYRVPVSERGGREGGEAAPRYSSATGGGAALVEPLGALPKRASLSRHVRLAGGWWLVLICSERKVLLAGCWWPVCCERKLLLSGGW
jgi:hypothetical protein